LGKAFVFRAGQLPATRPKIPRDISSPHEHARDQKNRIDESIREANGQLIGR
jgi:hypothetical protein